MKYVFSFLSCALFFVACHVPTPQEKGEEFASNCVKKQLYYPESYEPLECQVDTAFSPIDTPETMSLISSLADLIKKIQEQESTVKRKEDFYEMEKSSYQRMKSYGLLDSYTEYQYKEAKEAFENEQTKYEKMLEKLQSLATQCQEIESQEKVPCGWKIAHTYKAKTNGGQMITSAILILTDNEFTKVVGAFDEDMLNSLMSIQQMIQDNQY